MKEKIIKFILFVAAIVAIPGLYFQFKDYMSQHGGSVMMSLMNRQIENNDNRTIFVCVSDTNQHLNGISITPIYDNSSEYPVNGFDLRYSVDVADGAAPVTNDFFTFVDMGTNEYQYKYKENVLPQFSPTYEPFKLSAFPLKNSRYIIKSKATYSGAPCPYIYTVYLWLRVVPKYSNQSVEDWRLACKQSIYETKASPDTYDAFYCCDDQIYNEFGKDFGSFGYKSAPSKIESSSEPVTQEAKPKKEKSISTSNTNISSTSSIPQSTVQSEQTSNRFVSYESTELEKGYDLEVKTEKPTTQGDINYLVYHFKCKSYDTYGVSEFQGNGTNTVNIRINEWNGKSGEITEIASPTIDQTFKSKIKIEELNGRFVISTDSDVPFLLLYKVSGLDKIPYVLQKDKSLYVYDIKTKEQIEIVQTMAIDDTIKTSIPWWHHAVNIVILILFLGGLFGIKYLWEEIGSGSELVWSIVLVIMYIGFTMFIIYYYVIEGNDLLRLINSL